VLLACQGVGGRWTPTQLTSYPVHKQKARCQQVCQVQPLSKVCI
jgi:hypothetical protein